MQNIIYSLIIPVYKNELNIPDLLPALENLSKSLNNFEIVFVVDGSPDMSYLLLKQELPKYSFVSQLILLTRNFGSFSACRVGLEYAKGDYFAIIAADLQEPPELVIDFFNILSTQEKDIVFGERISREDPWLSKKCSQTFWYFYKKFIIPDMPIGGVDTFACNKHVRDSLLLLKEQGSSLIAQLFWLGFRRAFVPYSRRKREKGKSAWNFSKKMNYLLDSLFSFSDLPILVLLYIGIFGILCSVVISLFLLFGKLSGAIVVSGYVSTVLLILFTFAVLLVTQGIIGCYLWRCLENTKQRPLALILTHEDIIQQKV